MTGFFADQVPKNAVVCDVKTTLHDEIDIVIQWKAYVNASTTWYGYWHNKRVDVTRRFTVERRSRVTKKKIYHSDLPMDQPIELLLNTVYDLCDKAGYADQDILPSDPIRIAALKTLSKGAAKRKVLNIASELLSQWGRTLNDEEYTKESVENFQNAKSDVIDMLDNMVSEVEDDEENEKVRFPPGPTDDTVDDD